MERSILILLIAVLLVPAALCDLKPLVLVGCFDGQIYPPQLCLNYTQDLVDLATEAVRANYADKVEIGTFSDWFFFLDAITMPNVIGAIISLREGLFQVPALRQRELLDSFERGLGLVGIHGVGYYPCVGNTSRDVFPLEGTRVIPGKIVRGKVTTSRHTHLKYTNHTINAQSPELLDLPDAGLVFKDPIPEGGWWMPEEGNVTVLYVSTTATQSGDVPSILLYERKSGRSVYFAGLRHIDATGRYDKDPNWFNHSLSIPEVRQLLTRSLVYVLEPFGGENALKLRMEESSTYLEGKLADLRREVETGERALNRQRDRAMAYTLLVAIASAAGVIATAYVAFIRRSQS